MSPSHSATPPATHNAPSSIFPPTASGPLLYTCDVTDESSVKAMMKDAGRELGQRIDVLVNNAANYATADFEQITLRQWDDIFASNTRGPVLVSREALKWIRRKRRGEKTPSAEAKIIHMGSLGGLRPWPTHAHYCSSKAALHMLTKVMAKALAPEIAVNAVAPGMIDLGEKSAAEFMTRLPNHTPMQRNGRADEIAAAVLFFATAPQFITGQILAVDGGLGLAEKIVLRNAPQQGLIVLGDKFLRGTI